MAFIPNKALPGGMINVFKLEGDPGNYLLVICGKSRANIIPLLSTKGSGTIGFIDPTLELNEQLACQDLINNMLKSAYKSLPSYTPVIKTAPAHSMKIESFVQLDYKGNKATDELLFKYLTAAGYDVSNLTKSIKAFTKERDYSAQAATPEGKKRLEIIGSIVKKIDGDIKKSELEVQLAFESIKQGKTRCVMISGPAGTGKSIAAYIISYTMNAPLITYQASEGMQIEDMVGQFIPSSDPSKQFEYCLGLLLKAYTQGYQMLIDEVNTAPAGILSILNQFTDDTPTYTASNGITYTRHPNFVLYLTLNPGYEGTNVMNQALKSRFAKVALKNISSEEFVYRMITYSKNRCGCELSADFYKELYDFQPVISTQANNCGESVAICIRNAQQLTDFITNHPLNETEFTAAMNMSYTNNIYLDNDNLKNLEAFQSSEEFKVKVKKLFSLYDYRVIDSVEVEYEIEDILEAPVDTSGKSARVNDDLGLDDFEGFDDLDSAKDTVAETLGAEIDETEDAESEDEVEDEDEAEDLNL